MWNLSAGSIATVMSGGKVDKPVMQILGVKKAGSNASRYRLHISDGEQASSFAMLATQLNHLVDNNKLERFTVIRVENYMCNFIPPDKHIFVILEASIVAQGSEVGRELGNPKLMKTSAVSAQAPAAAAQQQQTDFGGGGGVTSHYAKTQVQSPTKAFVTRQNFGESNRNIHPIVSLTPYQNRWTIRARVTNKSHVRTWSNSRGEGKLFSMDLLDESGEIRATCFNDQCDKFYNMIELNKIYYVTRGQLKAANKNFTSIKNDYEMTFNADTSVEPCFDVVSSVPTVNYSFVPVASLLQREKDMIVDVIGVLKNCGDVHTIMSRTTNKELKKRDLQLVDDSNMEVTLTIWGEQAESFNSENIPNPVIVVKGARLSDYGGRSLSTLSSSMLTINPNISEVKRLQSWYAQKGNSCPIESISKSGIGGAGGLSTNWKLLRQVKVENLGSGEKADYYNVVATIIFLKKDNCMYKACATEGCNKKVIDLNNGMYRCEKCNREFSNFSWRLLVQMNIADCTDSQWVTCFQESAEMILNKTAAELGELKTMDDEQFQKVIGGMNFKTFVFKLRSKMESFNDENRLKSVVVSTSHVDYTEMNKKLIADIRSLMK